MKFSEFAKVWGVFTILAVMGLVVGGSLIPAERTAAVERATPEIAAQTEARIVSDFLAYSVGERRTDMGNEYQPVRAKVIGCVTRIRSLGRLALVVESNHSQQRLRSAAMEEAKICTPQLYETKDLHLFNMYIAAVELAGYEDAIGTLGPEFLVQMSKAK